MNNNHYKHFKKEKFVDGYQIMEQIGRGANGFVFKGLN